MRRRRLPSRVLLPLLITAIAVTALGAPPAQAATLPVTAMTVEGSPGARLLGSGGIDMIGSRLTVTPGVDQISYTYDNSSTGTWDTVVEAPTGQALAVGTYATADAADATHARLHLAVDSRSCSSRVGTLQVHAVTRDLITQVLTSFAATYVDSCEGTPAIKGELRFASDVDYARFGAVQLGTTSAVKVLTVKAGTLPVTYGTAVLGGARPGDFRIVGDTCRQQTVAPGASCTISVTAAVTHAGPQQATVTVPQTAPTGNRLITLAASGTTPTWGTYSTVKPARVLDTRTGVGAAEKPLAAGTTTAVTLLGRGGIPTTGVSAVVLNLTATQAISNGYLSAWPAGVTRPTASSLNYRTSVTRANLVTVAVGAGGKINLYNSDGRVHALADVVGYYRSSSASAAGQYFPVAEERLFDSRTDGGSLAQGESVQVVVSYERQDGTSLDPSLRAAAVNITAVGAQKGGYLVAWDGSGATPATSTLNFGAGVTTANTAIVKLGPCQDCGDATGLPSLTVENRSPGRVHVLVDIAGLYDNGQLGDGLNFHPTPAPVRIVDTRIDRGAGTLGPQVTKTVKAPASVAGDPDYVLVTNTAAVRPTSGTFLTLWDEGTRPGISNVSVRAGQTVANGVNVYLGSQNTFRIYNGLGTTEVLVDVVGTMQYYSTAVETGGADRRAAATRPTGSTPTARPVPAVRR